MLSVEATGSRIVDGRPLGVLLSPWFTNLVLLLAKDEDWGALVTGAKETIGFSSGEYEFIHNTRELVGGHKACSLFSLMGKFKTQMQAVEVGRAVMAALFDLANQADTDGAAYIRAAREAELAPPELGEQEVPILASAPSRRAVLIAGLASDLAEGP